MGRIDVERKRKTLWPWVIGVFILVLVLAGIMILLAEDAQEGPDVAVPTVADTHPPTAIPRGPYADPTSTGVDDPIPSSGIIGRGNVGESARLEGQVVATGEEGFWIVVTNELIRVESDRSVSTGDTVTVTGMVDRAGAGFADRIAEVLRASGDSDWRVVRDVVLVEG